MNNKLKRNNLQLDERIRISDHDNMFLCITDFGSHHSYLEGIWPINYSWLDRAAGEFLNSIRTNDIRIKDDSSLKSSTKIL